MRLVGYISSLLLLLYSFPVVGQSLPNDTVPFNRVTDLNPRVYKQDTTSWIISGICKPLKIRKYNSQSSMLPSGISTGPRFIKISGNIHYDFLYRSFADTPYYQRDFRQHTLQTSLSITVKDRYPFRANFMVRHSNSPFFKNFFDGGLQFDRQSYERMLRDRLAERILSKLSQRPDLANAAKTLEELFKKYELLKSKLNSDGIAQRIIEEREKLYFNTTNPSISSPLPGTDIPGNNDALRIIDEKKKELDSLKNSIDALSSRVDSLKNIVALASALVKQKIYKAKDLPELSAIANENGIVSESNKLDKFLSDIRSVGIGRTVLDYSELTVKNVSLTGFTMEYNPGFYAAVAAGKVDYGFRDFFGRNNRAGNQHLVMGRIGLGDIDRRAIILSLYTGRKMSYGGIAADTITNSFLVTGYSIEGILKKDAETMITAELAKSTRPVTGRVADNKETGSLFRFSDNTNLGISIKGKTILGETNTRLSGFFRKTGENFQSFSLFNYNTDQVAWLLRADQSFMKDRIGITAMLRRNDFVNPFTEKTFKTTTVFKSMQLQVRIPKWPSLSVGYFPGSQLYIIDRDRIRENVYYILNGTIVHNYELFDLRMVSSAMYNNYSSRGTDSGFVRYSGINYMLSQSVLLRKMQLQGNFVYTDQEELQFFTLDGNLDVTVSPAFRFGGGVKYNKVITGAVHWGGQAQVVLEIKKLGGLQLQYEKSFLPTIQQTLFPVEMGRLSWFKYF